MLFFFFLGVYQVYSQAEDKKKNVVLFSSAHILHLRFHQGSRIQKSRWPCLVICHFLSLY